MKIDRVSIEIVTDPSLIQRGFNFEFTCYAGDLAMRNGVVARISQQGIIAMISGNDIPAADRPRAARRVVLKEGESIGRI